MRLIFKRLLVRLLSALAVLTIKKYRPGIIGITGTVGKTSAKEAICAVLKTSRNVRASHGNFNNEIGLPLTILGEWAAVGGIFFWCKVFCSSIWRLLFNVKYPEILILEYAADRPGDIKYLLNIARPNIGVVTAIGDIPVHVEFYSGPDEVAREKAKLVETLPVNGFAILNYDDIAVLDMRDLTRAHVMTYGFQKEAEVKISAFEYQTENQRPTGMTFKIEYSGSFVPIRLNNALGKAQAYAAAAAAAVGLAFGMNLVKISEALSYYQAPPHRMKIISGLKDTVIIDDSYNASPLSMEAALHALNDLPGKRKIAVLGDMLELGKYAIEAHEKIGRFVARVVDILIVVGSRAKFIAEEANKRGLLRKNIFIFDQAHEAGIALQDIIKQNDLILIKGSHAIGLEAIVEEVRKM